MVVNKYPYTDMSEMNFDWLIAEWAKTKTEWTETRAEFDELKSYVMNYFDNLDVQQEINNKLDAMYEGGQLSLLIAPYVASGLPDVVSAQIGDVVAAQIGDIVAAQIDDVVDEKLPTAVAGEAASWLSEHVDPDTGYVIDDSLTIAGAAADAKAAGDAINDLDSALTNQTVTWQRFLTSDDSAVSLKMGVYGMQAAANTKPSNLPSNFPSTDTGLIIALDRATSPTTAIDYLCISNYNKKIWFYSGYGWTEITTNAYLVSYVSSTINTLLTSLSQYFVPEMEHVSQNLYAKDSEASFSSTQFKFITINGISDVPETYTDWYVSEEITVTPLTFYFVTASAQYTGHSLYQFLDSDGNIIYDKAITGNDVVSITDRLVYTPFNAATMRIATVTGLDGLKLYTATEKDAKKWLGKKWAGIGDSLTAVNATASKKYHDLISDETGITFVNLGAGGTGYKKEYDGNGAFISRVDSIPLDTDIVTIFGSGNDASYTIGTPSDNTTDTLCGCINLTIEAIFTRLTTCKLGIVTPTPWQSYNPNDDTNWMAQYSEAIVAICKRWGIPCLDLYHCSNLRPWDSTFRSAAYYNSDGVHPNNTGHAIFAPMFEKFLDGLLLH